MDENTARFVEQLKRDPARLQALLRSPDGQALLQLLNRDGPDTPLQQAAQSASQGNPAEAARLVGQYLKTPDGASLAERVRKLFNP